ncbi:hypothetical protein K439DRAFT_441696 [Ramaria rubella]|nr:hypothetical protein K439DRAFT_441696 [Ramaria rubella]
MQWNSTSITLTENVAVEQLGRSPHGSSATHHPNSSAMELWASTSSTIVPNQRSEPRRRKIPPVGTEYFEAALLHADGQCNHVNSNGMRCKITAKKSTKNKDSDKNKKIANHWLNCHAVAEVIKLHKKTLDFEKCTVLKSAEMVSIAEEYCLRCPVNGCGCEFVDISSFKRHIQNNIAPHGRERSDAEANVVVASVKPRRLRPSNDFNNGTEEAVWRLLEARRRTIHD